jgi:putative transposase
VKNTNKVHANAMGFYPLNGTSVIECKDNLRTHNFENSSLVRQNNICDHLVIILDNSRYHICQDTRRIAELLGITLVYLPFYSPDLNPIELVWKSLKRRLSTRFLLTLKELVNAIIAAFYKLSESKSFASGWIATMLDDNKYKKLQK